MNALFDPAVSLHVVLTLGHFLWQGLLIGTAAWLAGVVLRRARPVLRYRVYLAALAAMAACPIASFIWLSCDSARETGEHRGPAVDRVDRETDVEHVAAEPMVETTADVPQPLGPVGIIPNEAAARDGVPLPNVDFEASAPAGGVSTASEALDEAADWRSFAPWLTAAYLAGVLAMFGRLVLGLRGGRKLRRKSEPVADPELLELLARRAAALGLRTVPALAWCREIAVPTVVGVVRPAILLPLSLTSGLTPDQLAAVLTHELAHVRRWDPLVNVLQRVVEALLFFHPLVWFVSRRARQERENCCDDLVLAAGTDPVNYASSLLDIAERAAAQRQQARATLVALRADGRPSELGGRIRRLLGAEHHEAMRLNRPGLMLCVLVALLAVSGVSRLAVNAEEDPPPNEQQTSAKATLPNGVVVELVGVGFHPSQDRPWWQADGTKLETRPYEKSPGQVMPGSPEEQADCREFRIEIHGLPREHAVTTDYGSVASAAGSVYSEGLWVGDHAAGPFKSHTTSIRVGLTTEPFGPTQPIDARGRKQEPVEMAAESQRLYDHVVPLRVEESEGRTELVLEAQGISLLRKQADWQLYAIDVDGREQRSTSASGGTNNELALGFPLPPDRVARFEYRLRPYRHWVTFDNVSLEPGQRTDVEVEIEVPEKQNPTAQATLPNGVVVELVGVAVDPWEDDRWWRPDGGPLADIPEIRGRSTGPTNDLFFVRSFVLKARNLSGDAVHQMTVAPSQGGSAVAHRGDDGSLQVRATQSIPKDAETAAVRFGFAASDWRTVLRLNPTGEPQGRPAPLGRHVGFDRLAAADDGSELVLRVPDEVDGKKFEYRAYIVDETGTEHRPVRTGKQHDGNQVELTHKYPVAPDRVRGIRVQAAAYRHWVTFRNVALHPGQRTDVEIETEAAEAVMPDDEQQAWRELEAMQGLGLHGEPFHRRHLRRHLATLERINFPGPQRKKIQEQLEEPVRSAELWRVPAEAWPLIARLESLHDLRVVASDLRGEGFRQIAGLPNLRRINLVNSNVLPPDAAALKSATALEHVEIMFDVPADPQQELLGELTDAEQAWAEAYRARPGNRDPIVRAAILTDRMLEELRGLPRLRTLRLGNTHASGRGVEAVGVHRELEVLDLNVADLTPDAARAIGRLKQLRKFRHAEVSDETLAAFAGLTKLEELELWAGDVTDAGVQHVLPLKSLRKLALRGSSISDAGLLELAALPHLERLDLKYGKGELTAEGLARFQRLKPQCEVIAEAGEKAVPADDANDDVKVGIEAIEPVMSQDEQQAWRELEAMDHLGFFGEPHSRRELRRLLATMERINFSEAHRKKIQEHLKQPVRSANLWRVPAEGWPLIGRLESLHELEITASELSDEALRHVARLPNLKRIRTSTSLTSLSVPTDAAALKTAKSLEHIEIWEILSNVPSNDRLLEEFRDLPRLRTLRLKMASVSSRGVEAVGVHTELEELQLRIGKLTPEAARAIGRLKQLRKFGRATVSDETLAEFAGLTNLEELELWSGDVTDAGVRHLTSLKRLRKLSLGGCSISDAGLLELAALPHLERLNLKYWKGELTPEGLARFQRLKPQCEVVAEPAKKPMPPEAENAAAGKPVAAESAVAPADQTPSDREAFAEAVAARVAGHLPFASDAHRQQTAAEFRELVQKYGLEQPSLEFAQSILDALGRHLQRDFPEGPKVDDLVRRDQHYVALPSSVRMLQWRLFMALRRQPLNERQQGRLAEQNAWIRDSIRSLPQPPEGHERGHAEALADFQAKIDDPLSPMFKEPLTDEQFAAFKILIRKDVRAHGDTAVVFIVFRVLNAALQTRYAAGSEIPVPQLATFDERPYAFGAGTNRIGLMFPSSSAVAGLNGTFHFFGSTFLSLAPQPTTPSASIGFSGKTPDELDEWFGEHEQRGHLIFDKEAKQWIGLRGTRLASIPQRHFFEADQIPAGELAEQVRKAGSRLWKLPEPISRDVFGKERYNDMAAVLTPEGRLFLLKVHEQSLTGLQFHVRQHHPEVAVPAKKKN